MFWPFLAALSEVFPTWSTATSGVELGGFLGVAAGFGGMLDGLGGRVGKYGWGGWLVVDGLSLPVGSLVVLAPDAGLFFSFPLPSLCSLQRLQL